MVVIDRHTPLPRYPAPPSRHPTRQQEVAQMLEAGHDIYSTGGENETAGFACRRCSMWARVRSTFEPVDLPTTGWPLGGNGDAL